MLIEVLNAPGNAEHTTISNYIGNTIIEDLPGSDYETLESKIKFLDGLKNGTQLTGYTANRNADGDRLNPDRMYTLINALAVIKKVSLYIYQPLDSGGRTLYLSHTFTNDKNPTSQVNLIYKGSHFNRLVLATDTDGQRIAIAQEEQDLNNLRMRLEYENSQVVAPHSPVRSSRHPISNIVTQDSDSNSDSDDEEIIFFTHSEKDFSSFVMDFRVKNLRGLNAEASCQEAIKYYTQDSNGTFELVHLALEKRCIPRGQTKQRYLKSLLERTKAMAGSARYPKRIQHYARIFSGKILVNLGNYQEAYDVFNRLRIDKKSKSFTQTYLVDISELILEHNYTPPGMERRERRVVEKYALEILEKLPKSGKRASTRTVGQQDILGTLNLGSKTIRDKVHSLINRGKDNQVKPRFLSHKSTQRRIENLLNNQGLAPKEPLSRTRETTSSVLSKRTEPLDNRVTSANKRSRTESSPELPKNNQGRARGDAEEIAVAPEAYEQNEAKVDNENLHEMDLFIQNYDDKNESLDENRILLIRAQYLGKQKRSEEAQNLFLRLIDSVKNGQAPELLIKAYIGLGNARYTDNTHGHDYDWYLEAKDVLGQNGDIHLLSQAYIGLGNARYTDDTHRHNYDWYLAALDVLGQNGDIHLLSQVYIGLGNARYEGQYRGENYRRVDWYLRAIDVLGQNGDIHLLSQVYIGLGNSRYTDDTHRHQYDWYLEAMDVLGRNGDIHLLSEAYIGLGNSRYTDDTHRHNYDWYLEAIDVLGRNGDIHLLSQAYIGLGNSRYTDDTHRHQYDWYLEAIDVLGRNGDIHLLSQAYIGLGNARYEGQYGGENYRRVDWYLAALQILGERGDKHLLANAHLGAGRCMKGGDAEYHFEKALGYNPQLKGAQESLQFLNRIQRR